MIKSGYPLILLAAVPIVRFIYLLLALFMTVCSKEMLDKIFKKEKLEVEIETLEDLLGKLDRNKYHVCIEMAFDEMNNDLYMSRWSVYRKDMPTEEYFSDKNKAILSSKNGNTIEDIKKLIEEDK